jgi:hypothetical protein
MNLPRVTNEVIYANENALRKKRITVTRGLGRIEVGRDEERLISGY